MKEYTGFSQSLQIAHRFPLHTHPSAAWNRGDVPALCSLTLSPTGQGEGSNTYTYTYTYSPVFLKLPSRFSNALGEQHICSVPGRILPLADLFLSRIFCWVCFSSFQASSRWLTSLISSGNSSAPVSPSWTTP